MRFSEFQNIITDALASIYDPSFLRQSSSEREAIIHTVRAAYYELDEATPSSQIDYAAAALWSLQLQFNDVVISHETAALSA